MAFVQSPKLASVRQSIAVRLNFGAQAAQSDSMRSLLDEFIRRATRELLLEAHWVELRIRHRLDLIHGNAWYDWPDNMDPGRLERLIVVSTSGDEFRLSAGIHPEERAAALAGRRENFHRDETPDAEGKYAEPDPVSNLNAGDPGREWLSMPLRYEIVNQQLCILPLPDTEVYPYMLIEGYSRPPAPRHNDDLIPLDEEALIQKATVIGKLHFSHKDAGAAAAYMAEYIKRLRPMQSEGETIRIGGHFSRKFPYNQRRGRYPAGENYWLLP